MPFTRTDVISTFLRTVRTQAGRPAATDAVTAGSFEVGGTIPVAICRHARRAVANCCRAAASSMRTAPAGGRPDHLTEIVEDCIERRLFTVEDALRRLAEPDIAGHRGAELLRRALPPT